MRLKVLSRYSDSASKVQYLPGDVLDLPEEQAGYLLRASPGSFAPTGITQDVSAVEPALTPLYRDALGRLTMDAAKDADGEPDGAVKKKKR